MTLTPFPPAKLDELALRLLDVAAIVRKWLIRPAIMEFTAFICTATRPKNGSIISSNGLTKGWTPRNSGHPPARRQAGRDASGDGIAGSYGEGRTKAKIMYKYLHRIQMVFVWFRVASAGAGRLLSRAT